MCQKNAKMSRNFACSTEMLLRFAESLAGTRNFPIRMSFSSFCNNLSGKKEPAAHHDASNTSICMICTNRFRRRPTAEEQKTSANRPPTDRRGAKNFRQPSANRPPRFKKTSASPTYYFCEPSANRPPADFVSLP
jgi:hypothetical protein